MTELQLHHAVAGYLHVALCPPVFWSSIGHGWSKMTKGAAGRLKRAGLKPGIPDVMILHGGAHFWLELKAPAGRLSPAQIDAHYAIKQAGGHVAVCRSPAEVQLALKQWNIPMRNVMVAA